MGYPGMNEPGEITRLLRQFGAGDNAAAARLWQVIYGELKKLAQARLRHEHEGHDLQPTALVHEAYLRLIVHEHQNWENRGHFFAAAANVMRRILIDHARARQAQKRSAPAVLPLDESLAITPQQSADLLDLDEALTELEQISPRQARVVELRYFAGLSVPDVAQALSVHPRSVDRDWATARAWLRARLQG